MNSKNKIMALAALALMANIPYGGVNRSSIYKPINRNADKKCKSCIHATNSRYGKCSHHNHKACEDYEKRK